MAKVASREVIESLGAFLTRSTALSEEDIRMRMKDLGEGGMRAPDSSSDAFCRAHVLPSAEAVRVPRVPDDENPSKKERAPAIPSGTTKLEPSTADSASSAGNPRLAGLRERHPTVHSSVAFPEHALEAADLPADVVRARLAQLNDYVAACIQAGELPCLDLPDLHRLNSIYDSRGNVFLGHNVRRLSFDRQGSKAFMRLLLTLEKASENLRNGVCVTKRGLYYEQRAKLHDEGADQVDTNRAIAALANILGVRRKALGFVEAPRGLLYGRLVLRNGGEVVDVSKMGRGGHAVPRFTDDVEILSSDAAFILVVEKLAVAFRLAEARFWDAARCIIVCGAGYPSLSTREFVRDARSTRSGSQR